MKQFFINAWSEFKSNAETYLALIFGIIGAIIGILGADASIVIATTSGILTLIAFGILTDRKNEEKLLKLLHDIEDNDEKLTERLEVIEQKIEVESVDFDDFLQDRTEYIPFPERIKGARTLWIYAASAVNMLSGTNLAAIYREILRHPDGQLRVVIQNPAKKEAVRMLVMQLDEGVDVRVQQMAVSLQETLTHFQDIENSGTPGNFQYKLLSYSPGFSLVIIDPEKPQGVVIPEFYGYHNESTESRMHIEITRQKSQRWYQYWVNQFHYIWEEAREPGAVDESQQS